MHLFPLLIGALGVVLAIGLVVLDWMTGPGLHRRHHDHLMPATPRSYRAAR